MTDVGALLKRETTADRIVSELVQGARSDVVEALGGVAARERAVAFAEQVKAMIREVDQVVKASVNERETLRVEVADLREKQVKARADLDVARLHQQRSKAGVGGDVVDVPAAEDQVRALEREWSETRSRLTTTSNRATMAERQKAALSDLLRGLEAVPVPDGDLLSVLGGALANGD